MTPRHPFAIAVVELVARAYGIDPELIWGGDRLGATITEARWLSWGQAKKICGWSSVETGTAFGTDGSTVLHGLKKLAARAADGTHTPWYSSAAQALDKLSLGDWQAMNFGVSGTAAPAVPPRAPSLSDSGSESSSALSSPIKPVSKPARDRSPKQRLRMVPAGWEPKDAHRDLAKSLGVNFDSQLVLFKDHEFKDPKSNFDAAFRTWLRRAATYAPPPGLVTHQKHRAEETRAPAGYQFLCTGDRICRAASHQPDCPRRQGPRATP